MRPEFNEYLLIAGMEPARRAHRRASMFPEDRDASFELTRGGCDVGSAVFQKARRGYMASIVIVRNNATAEPPAHVRLVSGHDPFGRVAK